jgi:outer membrane biosynthesis protein TonB
VAREIKEFDPEALAAKPMTALQEHLLAWILEKTGVTFATKKEEAAFALGVKYTVNFRTYHQASEENQERLAAAAAAREAEADEAPAPAPKAKAKPAPAEEAPAPKKAAKKVPTKAETPAAPVKKVKPAKGAKPKPSAGEAPF